MFQFSLIRSTLYPPPQLLWPIYCKFTHYTDFLSQRRQEQGIQFLLPWGSYSHSHELTFFVHKDNSLWFLFSVEILWLSTATPSRSVTIVRMKSWFHQETQDSMARCYSSHLLCQSRKEHGTAPFYLQWKTPRSPRFFFTLRPGGHETFLFQIERG